MTPTLDECLKEFKIETDLLSVLNAIANAVVDIGQGLRDCSKQFSASATNTQNDFGDHQLQIDVTSDKAVFKHLKNCGKVETASSEETTDEVKLGGSGYSVAFDPLDGSSIVGPNFAVGSIFGVWPGSKLEKRTGREQVAACMAMYGPRITMAVALGTAKCVEVTYSDGQWVLSKQLQISAAGKVFAPGNLRASFDNVKYKNLVDHWLAERYTLRYTGGMVPDVYHILFKGKGVFTNISSTAAKAKLRLLYECAPIAFIVEAAGGASLVDPAFSSDKTSVLDIPIDTLDQRIGICYGGVDEVKICHDYLFAK